MVQETRQDALLVTDSAATTRLLLAALAAKGIRGTVAADARGAIERILKRPWDLVVVDVAAPGGGLEIVRLVRRHYPELPVVMLSDEPSVAAAVEAIREGCHDFLPKPVSRAQVERLLESVLPSHAVALSAAEEADSRCLYQIAGRSPLLFETIALAKKVAPTSLPVLITGESGTGKELMSYLVHRASRRAQGPYVRINCAALSESLLESELFGHERGAFTGAYAQRKGRFERAHGGTLLLDEVSETGIHLQAELLRVLEQQDFERVGGTESISVNVRILSTTNRDLALEVRRGAFRADLYYRLCGVRIPVAPLRHRREDIPVLAWHFVNRFAHEVRRRIEQLDGEMMETFLRYHWPGNVRQLRNIVRTALVVGEGPVLSLAGAPWLQAELTAPAAATPAPPTLRLRDVEQRTILEAMRLTRSHQARAARLLGITDRTLREKLRRYRAQDALGGGARTADAGPRPRGDAGSLPEREAESLAEAGTPWDAGEPEPAVTGETPCLKTSA